MLKIFIGVIGIGFVRGLLPLIVVPIFINEWGSQDYSVWLESMAISAFLGLFGLGLNNFGVNRSQIAFKQDKPSKYAIYDSLLTLNIIIYLTVIFLSFFFVNIIDLALHLENKNLVYIFAFYNAATILHSYINLSLRTLEKFHISLYLSIAYNVILYSGIILFIFVETSLEGVAFWMFLAIHLSIIITFLILRYSYGIKFKFRRIKKRYLLYIYKSYKFLYFQVADYVRINLPIVFLGSNVNPLLLVTYTVNRTLANLISQVYLVLHNTIMQKVTSNFAEGNPIDPKIIYQIVFFIMLPILCSTAIILIESYDYILSFWIRDNSDSINNLSYAFLLICSSFFYSIWNLGRIFLVATNNFSRLSVLSLFHSIGFMGLGIIGFYLEGLLGFILGGIVAEIFFGIILINYEIFKFLEINTRELITIIIYLLMTISGALVSIFLIDSILLSFAFSFIIYGLIIILILLKFRKIIMQAS